MKKAQAALEYLMTYGWAILIIAIVAAALYYMNVFGGACSPSATGFPPSGGVTILTGEFLVNADGSGEIIVRNNAGQTVTIQNTVVDTFINNTNLAIASGGSITFFPVAAELTAGSAGACYRFSVSMNYVTASLTTVQTATGTIQGAYQ